MLIIAVGLFGYCTVPLSGFKVKVKPLIQELYAINLREDMTVLLYTVHIDLELHVLGLYGDAALSSQLQHCCIALVRLPC